MNFGHPKIFWLAAAILPLLALFLWATWRKRQALVRSFVQNKALAELTLGSSTAKLKLRRWLLFLGVAALVLTMARPQWGFAWEEATQRGRDIVVAIDTSRSMLAQDLQPNRLARSKFAALDLLKLGKFDRFGLVAFSGTAFLQCPLTFDDEAFRQSVQILEPGIIPQGGTAIGEAIDAAQRAFSEEGDDNHRILVLFTDGEDHEEGVMKTVREAVNSGMKIFTVGVGTPAGELLRVQDEAGQVGFLKDASGNVVKSRLNQPLLQEIANKSGGLYFQLQGANVMEVLYQRGLAPLPTSERSAKLLKRFKEQFYWPLSIAIFLFVLEVFIPEGRRAARSRQTSGMPAPATVIAVLTLLLLPGSAIAASKAERHYKAGEYKSALSEYQEMLRKEPTDPRLHYNAGAAAYHANKFDLALKEFQAAAAASPEIDLQQQSFYNLANAEYRLGEANSNMQERMALWEEAVQHYEAALKLQPTDRDAEFNRDFVRKKLEELKKEQEKQKPEEKQDEKKKEEEQKDQEQKKDDQKQDQPSDQKQNSEEQKSDQQKQQKDPAQQDQQKQKQEQQQKEEQEKEQQPGDSQPQQTGNNKQNEQSPDAEGQAEAAQLGKMTPAQAKQLLDSQKNEEKALIFLPPERKSGVQNRTLKDW